LKLPALAFALFAVLVVPRASFADDAAPRATLRCDRVSAPGRLRCDLEVRVPGGTKIRWGDVVLARAPENLVPLRGRIGPRDATAREDDMWRWAFALVAREKGAGDLEGSARLVVCRGDACDPVIVPVKLRVEVGD
jgi:hypothetical protein